ncbi:MAG: hypothetical protein EPO11_03385 [Gammaproteobacteria bacterium]|nr:MAG: hypothetical protein EPO11_03385 [Gammaproteobacteria bacterium]
MMSKRVEFPVEILNSNEFDSLIKKKARVLDPALLNQNCYYLYYDVESNNWYFQQNASSLSNPHYHYYEIDSEEFERDYKKHLRIRLPSLLKDIKVPLLDGLWQMSGGAASAAIGTKYPIDNLADPIILPLLMGAIVAPLTYFAYKNALGGEISPVICDAIFDECREFVESAGFNMVAWEIGFTIGRCVIAALSATPVSFWAPGILAVFAGLFQGVSAVLSKIDEDKKTYGRVKTPPAELAKLFATNFASGVVWGLCNIIPFGSLLGRAVIKPVATIIATVVSGCATTLASLLVSKLVPAGIDKVGEVKKQIFGLFSRVGTRSSQSAPKYIEQPILAVHHP